MTSALVTLSSVPREQFIIALPVRFATRLSGEKTIR